MNPLAICRSSFRILVFGLGSEVIYLLAFVRSFPLMQLVRGPYQDMGQLTNHSPVQFWIFLGGFVGVFALLGAAWWSVRDRSDRGSLWIVLGLGAMFGLTMSFVYPVTANDVFGYIAQSLIMVQYHQNPIAVPPAAFPHDPLMSFTGGWAGYTAAYGPLGLIIDALPTFAAHRDLLANLLLLKLMFSAITVVCAYLVHEILRHVAPRRAVGGALLLAWNPMVLFETSVNGHNDIVMMVFAIFALLLVAEGSFTLGPSFLMASALVKYAALLLLPLVLVYAIARLGDWRQRAYYLARTGAVILTIGAVAYRPFWIGPDTFSRPLLEAQFYLYSFSSVLHNLFPQRISLDSAAVAGRLFFLPVYGYALWLSARSLQGLLSACFLATFGFLGLAVTNIKYWYIVWPNVLGATRPATTTSLAILVMAAGAELAAALNVYVWTWVGVTADNFTPINNVSYLAMFGLPAALLMLKLAADRTNLSIAADQNRKLGQEA